MSTYKVGDKVRLIGSDWDDQVMAAGSWFWEGAIKTVTGVDESKGTLRLQLSGDDYYWYITDEFAVEPVKRKENHQSNRKEIKSLKARVNDLEEKFSKLKRALEES